MRPSILRYSPHQARFKSVVGGLIHTLSDPNGLGQCRLNPLNGLASTGFPYNHETLLTRKPSGRGRNKVSPRAPQDPPLAPLFFHLYVIELLRPSRHEDWSTNPEWHHGLDITVTHVRIVPRCILRTGSKSQGCPLLLRSARGSGLAQD